MRDLVGNGLGLPEENLREVTMNDSKRRWKEAVRDIPGQNEAPLEYRPDGRAPSHPECFHPLVTRLREEQIVEVCPLMDSLASQ